MSQKYTKEFKETIVQLHETGYPVSDLVKEYGVANQTIYKWLQLYGKSGKSKAMVLSGSYASLLESVDSNYASHLKTIYTPPSRHAYFGVENHLRMDLAGKGEIPLPL